MHQHHPAAIKLDPDCQEQPRPGSMAALNVRPVKQRRLSKLQHDSGSLAEARQLQGIDYGSEAASAAEDPDRADTSPKQAVRYAQTGKQKRPQSRPSAAPSPASGIRMELSQIMVSSCELRLLSAAAQCTDFCLVWKHTSSVPCFNLRPCT